MKFYNMGINETIKELKSKKNGLATKDVAERLKKDGKNIINESKKETKLKKFLNEFNNLMIIILIFAALASFIISYFNKESYTDSFIILAIVFINATLGFIQELKADKAIESLKKMQIAKVKVRRNNKITVINSESIVKGDILVLEAGDNVPADARIIKQISLKVDESSLTGESIPVLKSTEVIKDDTPLAMRYNMIYSGTNVVYGKCEAIVCATGMNTEFGKIAKSLDHEEKEITPLQKKINDISKFLSILITIIIVIMFIIGNIKGMDFNEVLMLSISLAVAAIPEGLPAVITVTLSLGMSTMAKKNAIVRKMSSVETLGCTEIICSDKTGTITQNKMKVMEIYYNKKIISVNDILDKNNDILLHAMALNNDVEKNNNDFVGDPTEIALYECSDIYFNVQKLRKVHKRIDEIPFDSERKMMSTINENNNELIMYTKGSFDSIINNCTHIYENNKIIKLTKKKKDELKNIEHTESNKAYRVLAFAYKKLENNYSLNNIETDLIFIGMVSMIDPPREDVKEAITLCKKAHIKPIMITGDSLSTASAIAKEIGILENEDEAISGAELDKYSANELKKMVRKYSVYARVSPTNKLAIVDAWQANNKIVAMTGDGVNDAPALKNANIGVGMGITGTEVSKGVSDIILADDSFSSIVTAVKEGRKIFDNIRNILVYLITSNIAEILIVFIGMLFGLEIFLPIQILYINLVTDSIPAIALAFEKEDKNIMNRKVRKNNNTFFTPFLLAKILSSALLKTIAVLIVYFTNLKIFNINIANTTAFLTLILLEMVYAYSCRNLKYNIINKNIFANSYINKGFLGLVLLQLIIFFTPINILFNITSITLIQFSYCIFIVLIIFIINEIAKYIIRNLFKD